MAGRPAGGGQTLWGQPGSQAPWPALGFHCLGSASISAPERAPCKRPACRQPHGEVGELQQQHLPAERGGADKGGAGPLWPTCGRTPQGQRPRPLRWAVGLQVGPLWGRPEGVAPPPPPLPRGAPEGSPPWVTGALVSHSVPRCLSVCLSQNHGHESVSSAWPNARLFFPQPPL